MPQTLKGLSIRPSIDSLVVTGYHLRPCLRDLRSSQLNGSIRLCIKILGPDLDATYITVQFIRQCLPISTVEMVYLGDTICTQLNMIFLDLTIRDMPNLRFLYWAYVNRDEADDTHCMNSVIAFGADSTHYSEMDAVLEYVRYYVDIDEYYKNLDWVLSSCEKRGHPVQGLRLEQLDPQDDSKVELQIECNTGYNWRTAWLYV
ncbi:hypothetical protein QCA50_008133 [Cerrena zonata]|uniref:Uncharacterized protein n=1 Tax=Cerrena zonata TaxID=2478898 RepID=A0AAW0GBS1_9APHY